MRLGLGLGLTRPLGDGSSLSAQVAALFASLGSTPKLWLDPSDPTTRFQDQAGTTLVTADGQPYGRANDKSGGGNHVGQVTTTSRPLWRTDGIRAWAEADGADDSWVSLANFDCSSSDKVTVAAGIRKRSDASTGVVIEASANATTGAGTFGLYAPNGVANYAAISRGSAGAIVNTTSSWPAPRSDVLTVTGDISAPLLSLRVSGVPAFSVNASQGTGNYGSAFLNIFRRGSGSLPASVDLYGLMIIGRLLTADELSLCERYMAQKSGVQL